MAGHSKWANIQHRKGRQDKLRSKLFSKLSKDITIAAKLGGGGVIVEVSTDNRNRAAADVRTAFAKHGGNLGETGSVAFMFDNVGEIRFPLSVADEDTMMEAAIEAGADDVAAEAGDDDNEGQHLVYTAREDMMDVVAALSEKFPVPSDKVPGLMKMMDAFDDSDDVQNVYANFDISDEDMASLA